ncbi:MAG TPA: 3-isopropylmalate dehydratase small subunit [Candidatus Eubacterium avistercoris]|uniref:3-isopropylmalate dehydratase small subunit n=1 Tax=Candidatus Eubacterium avistercoris TaxID=2838567 RepID=A0A9D2D1L2_9FIRM|nr:3-isopropylmalate dehydratase small subunit [Candidatus Eubacterium avistercoris]
MIKKGKVWMFGDEINTDLIFPHSAFRSSPEEQCRLCMSDNRPGWSGQVQKGDILIAGKNFGTGSSRPGAVVLKRLGLAGMAAESFNGLFFRNCIAYGFPALTVPGITKAFAEGDEAQIDFGKGTVTNLRTGEVFTGHKLAVEMLEILEADGIEGVLKQKGYIR